MASSGQMARALASSLKAAEIPPRDFAAAQLAARYAQLMDAARGTDDEAAVYEALGPKLLATLTALGLTLAGRDKGTKGGAADVRSGGKLDELRARRAERAG